MHWLDISALLVLSGAALIGVAFGFIRPATRLAALVAAAIVTALLSPVVAGRLSEWNGAPVHPAVVVGATFVTALVILGVATVLVRRRLRRACSDSVLDFIDRMRWLDRLVGAAVSAALAAAVFGSAVYLADLALESPHRARIAGSETRRISKERVGAVVDSLSDQEKAGLKDLVDWLKRSKPAPAGAPNGPNGKNKIGAGSEGTKEKPPAKADPRQENKGSDDFKK